jgi:hypothetical protein
MTVFLIGDTQGKFRFEKLPGATAILDDEFSDWVAEYEMNKDSLPQLSLAWSFGYGESFRFGSSTHYGFFLDTEEFLEINAPQFTNDLLRIRGWFRSINIEPIIYLLS